MAVMPERPAPGASRARRGYFSRVRVSAATDRSMPAADGESSKSRGLSTKVVATAVDLLLTAPQQTLKRMWESPILGHASALPPGLVTTVHERAKGSKEPSVDQDEWNIPFSKNRLA